MRQRGIRFECDRCGASKFYELEEDGSFEETCQFHKVDLENDTHLCPNCYSDYMNMQQEFMRGFVKEESVMAKVLGERG